MLQLKKKDFNKIINKLKKRFKVKERHTGDWQITFFLNGRYIGRTKCSEGRGDIPPIIVQKIRKQLYFANNKELVDFKNCPLSCEEYITLLKQRKFI